MGIGKSIPHPLKIHIDAWGDFRKQDLCRCFLMVTGLAEKTHNPAIKAQSADSHFSASLIAPT